MNSVSNNSALVITGHILVIGSVGFILFSIIGHFDEISQFELNIFTVLALIMATGIAVLANTLAAFAWGQLVAVDAGDSGRRGQPARNAVKPKPSRESLRFCVAFRIWALANVAKYLPGNVFQYAGRFALARQCGVRSDVILVSMGLEVFFLCVAALSVVAFGYLSGFLVIAKASDLIGPGLRGEHLIIAVIVFSGLMGAAYFFPNFRKRIGQNLSQVRMLAVICAFGGYVVSFLAMGWSAALLLETLWRFDGAIGWLGLSSGYALAFLAGYIVPGAPGGIGIREVALVALFEAAIGTGLVLGLAVLLRLLSALADLLCFGAALMIREPCK